MMDHCTVTLVERSTDTKLLVLHEAEIWSAMTLDAFRNCSESTRATFVRPFGSKWTASSNTPNEPGVGEANWICVVAAVAVKTTEVVAHPRFVHEFDVSCSVRFSNALPFWSRFTDAIGWPASRPSGF